MLFTSVESGEGEGGVPPFLLHKSPTRTNCVNACLCVCVCVWGGGGGEETA